MSVYLFMVPELAVIAVLHVVAAVLLFGMPVWIWLRSTFR